MIRKTLLVLALSAAGLAQAATYSIVGSFDDAPATNVLSGSFSLTDSHLVAGLAGSIDTANLTSLNVSFLGQALSLGQLKPGSYQPYAQFDFGALTGPNALFNTQGGGSLELQSFFGSSNFTYSVNGSDRLGTLTISAAVPEPQSYALLLGGLAAVGFIARRRQA